MDTFRTLPSCILLVLMLQWGSVDSITVQVSPCSGEGSGEAGSGEGSKCIDSALATLQNNTTLQLQRGRHHLLTSHNLTSLSSIAIKGTGASPNDTAITCEQGVGLIFTLTNNLTIENIEISNCGVEMNTAYTAISHHVEKVFTVARPYQVALIFFLCENVVMRDVAVRRANGTGIVSYNTMGSLMLSGLQISNNLPQMCSPTLNEAMNSHQSNNLSTLLGPISGGGAVILYDEFQSSHLSNKYNKDVVQLTITDSHFLNNTECRLTDFSSEYLSAAFLAGIHFLSGGGGGLSLLMSQQSFSVNVSVIASSFIQNSALFGSGAYLLLFDGVINNEISFINCQFQDNRYMLSMSSDQGGSGVAVFEDVPKPSVVNSSDVGTSQTNYLSFDNCTFQNNLGRVGGAIRINSFHLSRVPLNILLHNCFLQQNQAIIGAALYVCDNADSWRDSKLSLTLANSSIVENTVKAFPNFDVSIPAGLSGIVSLQSIRTLLEGEVEFVDNLGTAVVVRHALLTVTSESGVNFSSNQAVHGGGLRLISNSYLLLHYNSRVSFTNNSATSSGGAIYVDATALTTIGALNGTYGSCFLHFINVSFFCNTDAITGPLKCPNISNTRVQMKFRNNSSPLASLIYGSTLSTCPWAAPLTRANPDQSVYQILYNQYHNMFVSGEPPTGVEEVATQSAYLNVTHPPSLTMLSPGEQFPLRVFAYDRFDQPVPSIVYSRTSNPQVRAYLTENTASNRSGVIDNSLQLVAPNENLNVTVTVVSTDTPAQHSLRLTIKPCELGFVYSPQNRSCMCSPSLTRVGVSCVSSSSAWLVPAGFWVGPGSDNPNDSNLVILRCFEDLCREGVKEVFPASGDYSTQCREGYHRAGIGCGRCAENYSSILGSNQCKECTNSSLLLIPLFAFLGIFAIVLIFVMAVLNFTISDGYINGILFFANIVNYYIQSLSLEYPYSLVLAPVAWISLNVGVPVCFHTDLNPLLHAFYEFIFPTYLVILVIILVSLPLCFKWPAKLGLSTVNTLATILLIIYSTISAACFRIIAGLTVTDVDSGTISIRWAGDPDIYYFQGAHGALAFFAIVIILLFVIPFPFLLLFPACLYRTRFTNRFIPLYDAFWHPFEPRYRFWLGLRLLYRQLPFFLAVFVHPPLNLFIVALTLLLLLYLQLTLRPFKGVYRNALDSFFLMDMIVLFLGPVIFKAEGVVEADNRKSSGVSTLAGFREVGLDSSVFLVVILVLTYVVFLGIVAYYVAKATRHCYHKYKQSKKKKEEYRPLKAEGTINSTGDEVTNVKIEPLRDVAARQTTYSELREPLMDDGSLSLISVEPNNSS